MKPYLFTALSLLLSSSLLSAKVSIKGSDTLGAKMVPQLVESYQKLHPEIKFEIAAEGSNSCFKALLAGTCDIGMASRVVKAKELKQFQDKGLELQEHVVAYDMIAVIVNEKNPVEQLTLKQVEQIFTGEITSWKGLGGKGEINVYTRNTSSGTYKTFQKLAMSKKDYGKGKHIYKMAGSCSPLNSVARNPQAIGYCGLAYASRKGVKYLKVNQIAPLAKNARSYSLTRNLYFYTIGKPKKNAESFIEWVKKSPKAQKIISKVGFIPLQNPKR